MTEVAGPNAPRFGIKRKEFSAVSFGQGFLIFGGLSMATKPIADVNTYSIGLGTLPYVHLISQRLMNGQFKELNQDGQRVVRIIVQP